MDAMTVDDADCRRLYELIWKKDDGQPYADADWKRPLPKSRFPPTGKLPQR